MKKTIGRALGLAVLGASASTQAVDFDIDERTSFAVFGDFQYIWLSDERRFVDPDESLDEDPPSVSGDEDVVGFSELIDNDSLIGVAGERELDNGLTAYFLAEWEYTADQEAEDEPGLSSTGDSYIGVRGDFGELQLGNADGIYDDVILDVLDNFEYEGLTEFSFSAEEGDLLSYQSPDFDGFSFALQTSLKGDGAGLSNDGNSRADDIYPVMVVLNYEHDMFSVHLGYDDRALVGNDAEAQTGLAVTLEFDPVEIGLKFETIGDSNDRDDDGVELVGILAVYDFDVGELSIAMQNVTFDSELVRIREDRSETLLNASYLVDDDIVIYFETARYEFDDDEADYSGIGLNFSF